MLYYLLMNSNKMKNNNAVGDTKRRLSMRSSIPPCPGKIFPESLTPIARLMSDSHRSPQVENRDTITDSATQLYMLNPLKKSLK